LDLLYQELNHDEVLSHHEYQKVTDQRRVLKTSLDVLNAHTGRQFFDEPEDAHLDVEEQKRMHIQCLNAVMFLLD
jgi:hypothetical protein